MPLELDVIKFQSFSRVVAGSGLVRQSNRPIGPLDLNSSRLSPFMDYFVIFTDDCHRVHFCPSPSTANQLLAAIEDENEPSYDKRLHRLSSSRNTDNLLTRGASLVQYSTAYVCQLQQHDRCLLTGYSRTLVPRNIILS